MRIGRFVAGVLVVAVLGTQGPMGFGQTAVPAVAGVTVTVAAGTSIPLTLVSTVKSKSTHVGDAVRAQVAFPVTVGDQLAIPAGTYVEGVVTSLTARDRKTHRPGLEVHFTRLLFANGYSVALDAKNTEARVNAPDAGLAGRDSEEVAEADERDGEREGLGFMAAQDAPPTLPHSGPNQGAIIGGTLGGLAAVGVLGVVLGRRNARNSDAVLFDAGWQFAMVTQGAVVLDAGKVHVAAALPSGH